MQFDAYYGPLRDLIKEYNLDGFDLDIEVPADLGTVVRLINSLRNDMGPNFIITMAPVASALTSPTGGDLSGFSYFDLDAQTTTADGTKLVSFFNGQFYSGFGSPRDTSTYDRIISAGWDPARVVMGVLDSPTDGSGYVNTATVKSTISNLKAKYPSFGGVDGWEYFDAGSGDGNAQPFQWVQAIGASVFGAPAKILTKIGSPSAFPPHAFTDDAVANLTAAGASHFEAVRALNISSGDVATAQGLYHAHVVKKKLI